MHLTKLSNTPSLNQLYSEIPSFCFSHFRTICLSPHCLFISNRIILLNPFRTFLQCIGLSQPPKTKLPDYSFKKNIQFCTIYFNSQSRHCTALLSPTILVCFHRQTFYSMPKSLAADTYRQCNAPFPCFQSVIPNHTSCKTDYQLQNPAKGMRQTVYSYIQNCLHA